MTLEEVRNILENVKNHNLSVDEAEKIISSQAIGDVSGYGKIDNHRELRVGCPETIYCEGKTIEQVVGIIKYMNERKENILATRASIEMFSEVQKEIPYASFNKNGRVITVINKEIKLTESYIGIVSAGTSDFKVVEEARETAMFLGNRVEVITDVGVAGIHRIFNRLEDIRAAKVVIIVAGMEGALASVVGGLVHKPVIAVPTSVGYGANFGGVAALLSMLNSCASGVSVVNIDNGYGAAYVASRINQI